MITEFFFMNYPFNVDYDWGLTVSVLPDSPVNVSSLTSTTVDMFTSPLPVVSMMSTIFAFPSVVIYMKYHTSMKTFIKRWRLPYISVYKNTCIDDTLVYLLQLLCAAVKIQSPDKTLYMTNQQKNS